MTYTEFIKEIENNIAKANCNKLNIGEYEEKQKQIYKQIRAEVIDEVIEELELHSFELGTDTLPTHYIRLNDAIKIVKKNIPPIH